MNAVSLGIVLLLLLIGIFSVRSYAKKLAGGCCGGGEAVKRVRPADRNLRHYPYRKRVEIYGMVCANCARRVESAFNAREGMCAKADVEKRCAIVYGKAPLEDSELRAVVSGAGYAALGISALEG